MDDVHTASGAAEGYSHSHEGSREGIGSLDFALNQEQKNAINELWELHERSRQSDLIIGGPLTPERRALVNQFYKNNE
jgi:putative AlgH/UPF0301 family transcriptional regulator